MQKNTKEEVKKRMHINGFWSIFIVVVISMVAGGIIYAFAYGNVIQDEIDSSFFIPKINFNKPGTKAPMPAPKTTVVPK